jgi:hypothetical protein
MQCARGIVDPGEGFVEQRQPGRQGGTSLAVEAGDRGEQRHGEAERAFAAGGRAGELAPMTVLPALNAEAMPAAVSAVAACSPAIARASPDLLRTSRALQGTFAGLDGGIGIGQLPL